MVGSDVKKDHLYRDHYSYYLEDAFLFLILRNQLF